MLQDQAQCILGDYTKSCYQRQPGRSGTLMHVVGRLTSIFPKLVERLFFHETIGEIPISRLLVDMYQMKGHTNWDLSINGKKIDNFLSNLKKIFLCLSICVKASCVD